MCSWDLLDFGHFRMTFFLNFVFPGLFGHNWGPLKKKKYENIFFCRLEKKYIPPFVLLILQFNLHFVFILFIWLSDNGFDMGKKCYKMPALAEGGCTGLCDIEGCPIVWRVYNIVLVDCNIHHYWCIGFVPLPFWFNCWLMSGSLQLATGFGAALHFQARSENGKNTFQ